MNSGKMLNPLGSENHFDCLLGQEAKYALWNLVDKIYLRINKTEIKSKKHITVVRRN
jgi:hypothetical protein